MKKSTLIFLIIIFLKTTGFSQPKNSWKDITQTNKQPSKNTLRENFPRNFKLFELNFTQLSTDLSQVNKNDFKKDSPGTIILFPNSAGGFESFEVYEYSNFEPALQAKYPYIKSFIGRGIDDQFAQIRFSSDAAGIQAMIFRKGKTNEFIEAYSSDSSVYCVYESNRTKGSLPFTCSTVENNLAQSLNRDSSQSITVNNELLTFRLALSCNGEYSTYFGGTVANALAAMNATMTRVNGVFENDLSIHMNLISNNDAIIFLDPTTDPYTNLNNWNNQLQTTLTSIIGESNYNIGHMFGATGGGGNAGCIGCVCVDGQKGKGITSPADGIPAGDTFDIDYVAHEMGHQFGANHTFSHNVENAGVNVEPGSGSTIMGYAGITARDVQPHSDDYFIYASIKQIQENMIDKTCPVRTPLTNHSPITDAGFDYKIPVSTPFILKGSATDTDGDSLSYCWEQNDTATNQTGVNSAASPTKTGGPNWRSYSPTTTPVRFCPPLERVISNQLTTQGTDIAVEAVSSVGRELNFILTARDNSLGAGSTGSDGMNIVVDATSGPFVVTYPNNTIDWIAGTNQTVTWDVAGTDNTIVNTKFVDIYLSYDGGYTYPVMLASKVPNDGSETITVPNNVGSANRIMVKGYNNIFYDISNADFSISQPVNPDFAIAFNGTEGEQNKGICIGSDISFTFQHNAYQGYSNTTTYTATGTPTDAIVTFSPTSSTADESVTVSITNTSGAVPGFYSINVLATDGTTTKIVPLYLDLYNSTFALPNLTAPANLAEGLPTNLLLTWDADTNATEYDLEVALNDDFSNIIFATTCNTNYFSLNNLLEITDYFWRVLPKNPYCSGNFSATNKFTTGEIVCNDYSSINVPITIPTTANVTVNSTLDVPDNFILTDVNVSLDITHSWVHDVTITLISPNGTSVKLVEKPCTNSNLQNILADFNDDGTTLVCETNPALTGTIKPLQSLSAFNGMSSAGTWTLRVLDSVNQDGGSINNWSLNLCKSQVPLNINDNSIQNLMIYPNPSNGNFTVQFTSTSSDKIKIDVIDIRGRHIFTKDYENEAYFNQNINLSNVETGVYFISLTDGSNKAVRRIIIN